MVHDINGQQLTVLLSICTTMDTTDTQTTRRSALKLLSGVALGSVATETALGDDDRYAHQDYADDITQWVLRLGPPVELDAAEITPTALKREVRSAQAPTRDAVSKLDDVSIQQQTWIANTILVKSASLGPDELVEIEGVRDVHPNVEFESPEPAASQEMVAVPQSSAATYGLHQIDAPSVWDEFGTRGENARVAVLDSGVDDTHPDIELAEDGWAQFDANGNQLDTNPNDPDGHGTHVSGTATGGSASGFQIGVAPDSELLSAKVLDDGGTFVQIIAGIQWAVTNSADVINMSLGASGFFGVMVEPIRVAESLGTLVVSSAGNSGAGTTGTPGNIYDTVGVGATNSASAVATFSSGERIYSPDAWTDIDIPTDWSTWYTVPDLAAPGVDVISAYPGPTWQLLSGTSMASPHVAGVAALLKSTNPDLSPADLKKLLERNTPHPGGEGDTDTRYGRGITNAFNAVADQVHSGVLSGTVTVDGEPATAVTVETQFGTTAITDESGEYRLSHPEGTATLAANTFGLSTGLTEVDVTDETERDLELQQTVDVVPVQSQPADIAVDDQFAIILDLANLEELTVTLGDSSTVTAADVSLSLGERTFSPGESVSFDEPFSQSGTELVVTVSDVDDGAVLALEHVFSGPGPSGSIGPVPTGETVIRVDPTPASFEITEPNFQSELPANGVLEFNPTITNTGELTATKPVTMVIENVDIGGQEIDNSFPIELELGPGERASPSVPISFGDFPRQDATQRIRTPDDEVSSTFSILNQELSLQNFNVPDTAPVDRQTSVEVVFANNGELDGTAQVAYTFDGVVVASTETNVPSGGSQSVELSMSTDGLPPDTYTHAVTIDGSVIVETEITLQQPEIHESGVPIDIFNAVLTDGASTELSTIRSAVSEWGQNNSVNGVVLTLADLRALIDWWGDNQ